MTVAKLQTGRQDLIDVLDDLRAKVLNGEVTQIYVVLGDLDAPAIMAGDWEYPHLIQTLSERKEAESIAYMEHWVQTMIAEVVE